MLVSGSLMWTLLLPHYLEYHAAINAHTMVLFTHIGQVTWSLSRGILKMLSLSALSTIDMFKGILF